MSVVFLKLSLNYEILVKLLYQINIDDVPILGVCLTVRVAHKRIVVEHSDPVLIEFHLFPHIVS